MKRLKRLKGYWIFLIAALICFTLVGRQSGDVFSAKYLADDFYVRSSDNYTGNNVQPMTFDAATKDSVSIHTLQKSAISLKAGTYDVGFSYADADADTVLKIYSSDYISSDNSGGKVLLSQPLNPQETYCKATFTLDQDVNSVYIQAESKAPNFTVEYFLLESWGAVCNDTAFYCVITLLCAVFLFLLCNLPFGRVQPGLLGAHAISGAQIAAVSVLVCAIAVFVASLPLLEPAFVIGHDLAFHTARIEGLASALSSGQFPARVHGGTLNGFGYPNSYFYPELLLYFPAWLSMLGVHTVTCYKFYIILIHALTAALSYLAFKKLTGSRYLGLALSVVYVLNPYRLICAYYRAAVGEFTALAFLPILLYGVYAVIKGNQNDWPYLVLGATGIFQAHILSTEIVALACAVIALVFIRDLFTREKRVLKIIYAGIYTVLLNVWFLLPMLAMSIVIRPAVYSRTQSPGGYANYSIGYLFSTLSLTDIGPHMLGWVTIFAVGFYLVYRIVIGKTEQNKTILPFADVLCALTIGFGIATTKYVPWERFTAIPVLGKLLDTIQFPYRLLSVVGVAGAALAGYVILLWLRKKEHRVLACAIMVCFSIFTACLFMESAFLEADKYPTKFYYSNNMNNSLSVGQYEYLASTADISDIVDNCPVVTSENDTLEVTGLRHEGTRLSFTYEMTLSPEGNQIVLPLTYIPKYVVTVNGQPVESTKTDACHVAFTAPAGSGEVSVIYREPVVFRVFELVSLLSLAVLLARRPILRFLQKHLGQKANAVLDWFL